MFGRFPFAHCHFKIENNLLLGEITFSEKNKVSRMLNKQPKCKAFFFFFFFFLQNTGKFLTGIFAIIIASIWVHIFIAEG